MATNAQRAIVPDAREHADASSAGTVLHCDCDLVGVLVEQHERRLVAVKPIPAGTRMFAIEGRETPVPTRYSLQVGWELHLDQEDARDAVDRVQRRFWRYMNHACDPSTVIRDRAVVALRDIAAGDDVTFDYNTTEWDMAEPFACRCGSARCVGTVRGARHLTEGQRAAREGVLPAYLRDAPRQGDGV
jgi:hypothetical protein